VDDHTKANDQLKSIASKKGVNLPTDIGAKNQAMYDRLSKMSGAQFDAAYVQHMTMDHKKDVADFQKEASNGKDPAIQSFASQTLPTLQDHLKAIQNIHSRNSGSTSADRSKSKQPPQH
jgi:putative membrane protein